ncbi:MAG: hypothetical protein ABI865_11650 [Nitrosospira sp.]
MKQAIAMREEIDEESQCNGNGHMPKSNKRVARWINFSDTLLTPSADEKRLA